MKKKDSFLTSLFILLGYNFFVVPILGYLFSSTFLTSLGILFLIALIELIILIVFIVALVNFVNEMDNNYKKQKDINTRFNKISWNNKTQLSEVKKINNVKSNIDKNSASNITLSEDTWTCSCGNVNENYCVRCTRCLKER